MVGSARNDLFNFKWTHSLHLELLGPVHSEIGSFQPDFVPDFPWYKLRKDPFFHLLLGDPMSGLSVFSHRGEFCQSPFQVREEGLS